jgi:hypothetical protein
LRFGVVVMSEPARIQTAVVGGSPRTRRMMTRSSREVTAAPEFDQEVAAGESQLPRESPGFDVVYADSSVGSCGLGADGDPRAKESSGVDAGGEVGLQIGDDVAPADRHHFAPVREPVAEAGLDHVDPGTCVLVLERDDDVRSGAGLVVFGGPDAVGRFGFDHGDRRVEPGQPQVVFVFGAGFGLGQPRPGGLSIDPDGGGCLEAVAVGHVWGSG